MRRLNYYILRKRTELRGGITETVYDIIGTLGDVFHEPGESVTRALHEMMAAILCRMSPFQFSNIGTYFCFLLLIQGE